MMDKILHGDAVALLEGCPHALLLIDRDGRLRGYNQAFINLLGGDEDMLRGDTNASRNMLLAPLLAASGRLRWVTSNGEERHLLIRTLETPGESLTIAHIYEDITDRVSLEKRLDQLAAQVQSLSLRDSTLTSLYNRRGTLLTLEHQVARSRRYESPLSLMMIGVATDCDRPALLQRIAQLLRDQLRWADIVGCTQEHDFILVLQETSIAAGLKLADLLSDRISQIADIDPDCRVSRWIGLCECRKNDTAETLLRRSEEALGEARRDQPGTIRAH
jgi:diguanylate cyclase (GGDEF)-like protein